MKRDIIALPIDVDVDTVDLGNQMRERVRSIPSLTEPPARSGSSPDATCCGSLTCGTCCRVTGPSPIRRRAAIHGATT